MRFREVRRYFFQLFNDETVLDQEGQELPNDAAALQAGIKSARVMAADSISRGHLALKHRIEVSNDAREIVGILHFRDVLKMDASA